MTNTSQATRFTRRRLLQAGVATSAWLLGAASYQRVYGANERVIIAHIGTHGIAAGQHITPFKQLGFGCLCYCDADAGRFGPAARAYPDAEGYTDYRAMYDKHMNQIDAVAVGTPDHHHYPATIIAVMQGKHAYTQKPLTHTMWESRQLKLAAEKYRVATQMGNQGHASQGIRRFVEWVRSGKLGTIKEAHIWTDRAGRWWGQGNPAPKAGQPKPEKLDWDAWLGPAPQRAYAKGYHPFNWRGAQHYGTGAMGDMGCHLTDALYWAMDPGYPVAAELVQGPPVLGLEQYAKQSVVKIEFADKGDRPGFSYYWYEGGMKPGKPEWYKIHNGDQMPINGCFIVGDKGAIQFVDSFGEKIRFHSFAGEVGAPPQTIEASPGHHKEFYLACKGEKPHDYPKSNFIYAGMLTESVLLGTVTQKVGGRIEYDAEKMKITNNPTADGLITKEYRKGWEFKMG